MVAYVRFEAQMAEGIGKPPEHEGDEQLIGVVKVRFVRIKYDLQRFHGQL